MIEDQDSGLRTQDFLFFFVFFCFFWLLFSELLFFFALSLLFPELGLG